MFLSNLQFDLRPELSWISINDKIRSIIGLQVGSTCLSVDALFDSAPAGISAMLWHCQWTARWSWKNLFETKQVRCLTKTNLCRWHNWDFSVIPLVDTPCPYKSHQPGITRIVYEFQNSEKKIFHYLSNTILFFFIFSFWIFKLPFHQNIF